MYELLKTLYTIPRSITGEGFRKSLTIIAENMQISSDDNGGGE